MICRIPLCLLSATMLMASIAPARAETITSRAPQAHIDAFIADCKAKEVAAATCTCMVKKLSETRDGDAALDAMGLMIYHKDEAGRKAGMTPLLNRHGLRPSQLQGIVNPANAMLSNIAKECS